MYEEKQSRIDRAINMKEKSIAYFNSVNSAISLVAPYKGMTEKEMKEDLIIWRNWFFEQWQEWYIEQTEVPKIDLDKAFQKGEEYKKNVLENERIEIDSKYQEKVEETLPIINE